MKKKKIDGIISWLLIIGGLTWGTSIFGFNVVEFIADALNQAWVATVIYAAVGLSAVYQIYKKFK